MDEPRERERVLVVDDSWYMRVLVRDILETGGIDMVGVERAEDALEILGSARPNAILVDMVLPAGDGLSLTRELGLLAPDIPVLVVSGCTDYMTRRRALQSGATGFVEKPFGPAELLSAVEEALALSRERARQLQNA
jgi:DNA-binding NtrC family response regulator